MSVASERDTCGCCAGLDDSVPAAIFNRPGLPVIAYRSGVYSRFKRSMLAGLTRRARLQLRLTGSDGRALQGLVPALANIEFAFSSSGSGRFATTNRRERERVLADPALNGIDALEVSDLPAPGAADRWQSELTISFLNPPSAELAAIRAANIRFAGGARLAEIEIQSVVAVGDEVVITLDRPSDAVFSGALQVRSDEDLSIALIDAWAVVGDVLTFYIERTANEHYLGTATERRSVDALAHLIGYRLHPGLAAASWLAFGLEIAPNPAGGFRPLSVPGLPEEAPIAIGTRVQSIPGPGELPQTFETVEGIVALADWNRLAPRLSEPRTPVAGDTSAWLAGVGLDLNPGDLLLFVSGAWSAGSPDQGWDLSRVVAVEPDAVAQRTLVSWSGALTVAAAAEVHVMRQRASLFGHNAPNPQLFSVEVQGNLGAALISDDSEWDFDAISGQTIHLDTLYRNLEPGGRVILSNPAATAPVLATIIEVNDTQRADYALSGRVTGLELDVADADLAVFGDQNLRGTAIRLDSELMPLAEAPLSLPVAGASISGAMKLAAIDAPRSIIVRGKRARAHRHPDHALTIIADDGTTGSPAVEDELLVLALEFEPAGFPGQYRWRLRDPEGFEGFAVDDPAALTYHAAPEDDPLVSEVAVVALVEPDNGGALLTVASPLVNAYDRASVEIFGNVAAASHGESVRGEVLGSGDGTKTFQQFTLRSAPLTHLRDDTGASASTLVVWVNGVRWEEVESFFGQGPRDRVYVTRTTDEGKTVVQFSDGLTGARLPTGHENILADYRAGLGPAGHLKSDQLSLLMTRPLGVRDVTNPIAPAGAVARQEAEDARHNAPRSVLTLGKIVSLKDYADFALNYPGIAKASVVWTWDGARRGVLLTVAGVDGAAVEPGGPVYDGLLGDIASAGSTRVPLVVKSYRPATFRVALSIRVEPDRKAEDVLAAVKGELAARFSFSQREFGEIVSLSGIYAAVHAVPGVSSADINHLYRGLSASLEPFLLADAPLDGDPSEREAAELLTLDPLSLDDLEVQP